MTKGFTLIEVVLYIALLGMVLTAITAITIGIVQTNQKLHTVDEVQYNTRFVSERVKKAVRESISVNASASTFDSHPGTLTLIHPDGAEDPTIFSISNGTFQVIRGTGPAVDLTTENVQVTNFVLKDRTPPDERSSIIVELTISHNNPTGSNIYSYEESIEFAVGSRLE